MKSVRLYTLAASGSMVLFMLAIALTELHAGSSEYEDITPVSEPSVLAGDLILKQAAFTYKYKADSYEQAQQGWKLVGTTPTEYQNFNDIPSFHLTAYEPTQPVDFNFFFPREQSSVLGRDSTRYRQKFVYFPDARSDRHRYTKYAVFKARIKDGKLSFAYAVMKANEGGQMVAIEDYDTIRDSTSQGTIEGAVDIQGSISLGDEYHDNAGKFHFKGKKNAGKGKLLKL